MDDFVLTEELEKLDPQLGAILRHESERQRRKIIMIASESICPEPVRRVLASEFGNIYAEGYPSPRTLLEPAPRLSSFEHQLAHYRRYSNRRYYKGCEYVDILESMLRRRTAEVFANERASADEIFVNTQPLSGAAANNAVYNAFCNPGDVVLGPSLTHGGHLTHGSEVNRSGKNHRVVHYEIGHTGRLDYERIARLAEEHRPRLMIGGFSAYPWDIEWTELRRIADSVGAVLLADIAHLAGMVAAGLLNNPVGVAHVVSFTTHKTLCGPRGAMLLCTDPEIARKLDMGVFPGEQGGPHIHQMAAKAVAMKLAATDGFKQMQKKVLENAAALADGFREQGLELAYGGTNTHMCLVDLRKIETPNGLPLTGEIASRILDLCGIVCNKNTIHGDTNAIHPSGLRFGTTWATQRGFGPEHMKRLAGIIAQVLRGIVPFSYIAGRTDRGRGKVPSRLLDQASAEVEKLIKEVAEDFPRQLSGYPHFEPVAQEQVPESALGGLHRSQAVELGEFGGFLVPVKMAEPDKERSALKDGAALLDGGNKLWIEVGKGRAGQFLESVMSNRVMDLECGAVRPGRILDEGGNQIAGAVVARMEDDEFGYQTYVLGLCTPEPLRLLRWLRRLSDGYILHDEDIWLKVEGPVAIGLMSEQREDAAPMAVLSLRGPKAAQVLSTWAGKAPPEAGRVGKLGDALVIARPAPLTKGYDLLVARSRAAACWSQLVEAGAQPVGWHSATEVLGDDWLAEAQSTQQLDDPAKPFFVGRKKFVEKNEKPHSDAKPFRFEAAESEAKRTCLYERHIELTRTKNMVPFAGWRMPVQYSGILEEHKAVRTRMGLFDVSHMGVLEFTGSGAERFLDLVTTNYVPMLAPGQAHYSYLLAPDGRCMDDIIVYRLERDRFMVVVNAANADEDTAWLKGTIEQRWIVDDEEPFVRIAERVEMRNMKDPAECGERARVDIALQGPGALSLLVRLAEPESFGKAVARLRKFELASGKLAGVDVTVARTGYTGEEVGFEIFVHPEHAPGLWNVLLEEGRGAGLVPAGLGARDSLRCEAGFPLHGHELGGPHDINPIEAGYGSYVKLHKPFFVGRHKALEWHNNRRRTVIRFAIEEKGGKVVRAGSPVFAGRRNEYAGRVTSCVSTGSRQVGMAIVEARFAREGMQLNILPVTDSDRQPPARRPADLAPGDWIVPPRQAVVLERFASAEELARWYGLEER